MVRTSRSIAYVPALDGLRGVSVLAVMAYHLEYEWAPGGFLGVDVFFVLSGFLITSLLLEEWRTSGRIALGAFWARRVRRLLPAIALLLLAVAVYARAAVPPERLDRLRADALWTLGFGMNWHLIAAGRSYFDLFSPPSPLRHLWSLAIEEQFYLMWPLLLLALLRLTRGSRLAVGVLSTVGLVASATLMALRYVPADPSRVYYGTDTHAAGLLTGAVLSVLAPPADPASGGSRVLAALGIVALAAVLAAFALVGDRAPLLYQGGLVAVCLATGVVVAAARRRSPVQRLLAMRPLVWVGRRSYGLYLWHWPLFVALTPESTGAEGLALDAWRVGLSLAVTAVSYAWLEEPIRRAAVPPRVTLAATPVAAGVLAAVILVATRGGTAPASFYLTPGERAAEVRDVVPPRRGRAGARQPSIAILGDSMAASLVPGFARVLGSRGFRVTSAVLPGCGIVAEYALPSDTQTYEGEAVCARAVPHALERLADDFRPDLVVWIASRRDIGPRHVGDRVVSFATRDGDRALGAALEDVHRRITARGTRVALLTVPPAAGRPNRRVSPVREREVAHYNTLLRDFAAAHPDTILLVDLAAVVCPGPPPCPPMVEGEALRTDGIHFSRRTGIWVVKRLLPQLLAAGRF